jgi:hypothetical protein
MEAPDPNMPTPSADSKAVSGIAPLADDEKTLEILRTTAYHPKEDGLWPAHLPYQLEKPDDKLRRESNSLRKSLLSCFPTDPTHGLGKLNVFPPEILQQILRSVDIRTCLAFRKVNRKGREMVTTIPEYKAVMSNGMACIKFIDKLKIQPVKSSNRSNLTLDTLYTLLCETKCDFCDDTGPFVYLLNPSRCCLSCIRDSELPHSGTLRYTALSTVNITSFANAAKIPNPRIRKGTPVAAAVAGGKYGHFESNPSLHNRKHLINLTNAISVFHKPCTGQDILPRIQSNLTRRSPVAYEWQGYAGPQGPSPFVCAPLPFWNPSTRTLSVGVRCKACHFMHLSGSIPGLTWIETRKLSSQVYTKSEFLAHFEACKPAQRLLKATKMQSGPLHDEWQGKDLRGLVYEEVEGLE